MANHESDVVILGAGIAGLAAARRLAGVGLQVVVLEGRDRLGGRIDTVHDSNWPVPLERGAEFIHGTSHELWEILRAAALQVYEIGTTHSREPDGPDEALWQDVDAILRRLEDLGPEDLSFSDFLARCCPGASAAGKAMATDYVEGFNAADKDLISAQSLLEDLRETQRNDGERSFRLTGGYDQLVRWFALGCGPTAEIRLNRFVDEIRWEPGLVEVLGRTASGTPLEPQRASRAIVALPLGVLPSSENPSSAVRFTPRLEAKERAAGQMRMGPVVKVLLRFQEPFWASGALGHQTFWHASQPAFPTWWTHLPVHAPVLTGWSAGPAALGLTGQNDDTILDRALDVLASVTRLARPRLDQQLQSWHVCNWQADPLARGAYSYVTVGGLNARRQLAEPVADTLFFAGEATGSGLSGTVNAAIASGYRAADEVLRAVRPSVG